MTLSQTRIFFLYSLFHKQVQENTSKIKTKLAQENLKLQTKNKLDDHVTSTHTYNVLHVCITSLR